MPDLWQQKQGFLARISLCNKALWKLSPPEGPDHRDNHQIRYVPDNRYRLPDFLTDKTGRSTLSCGCCGSELASSVVSQG